MKSVAIRGFNNYDTDAASKDSGLKCMDASKAVQEQAEEADINVIVRRFGVTGELPIVQRIPLQVDIDEVLDYRTCLDRVKAADRAFASQPAEIRARFQNDARQFVDFFEDPRNEDEARKLGILPKKEEPKIEVKGETKP